jgi:hypothetical protein
MEHDVTVEYRWRGEVTDGEIVALTESRPKQA